VGIQELQALLDTIPNSIKYLVMSVTTRYEDLCKIAEVYDKATDFSLIFTKLDEAETLGSLINICSLIGKKVAYVTFGQNVPDDMESVKPEKIAKSILGLAGGNGQPYAEGGDL
jgi:flagellar biosynthesis protein FlhF